jgi:hypothetical protein
MSNRRIAAATLALATLAGCTGNTSPATAAANAETAALAPLRAKYDNTITGFDINGARVDVSVDLDKFDSMDPDDVPGFKANVLRDWSVAWSAQHPRRHAALTVRFLDYFGKTVTSESSNV